LLLLCLKRSRKNENEIKEEDDDDANEYSDENLGNQDWKAFRAKLVM